MTTTAANSILSASAAAALDRVLEPIWLARRSDGVWGLTAGPGPGAVHVPAVDPAMLGDPTFTADHHLTYPLVSGAMARGIASVELVVAMARMGGTGFFGAAGLPIDKVTAAIDRLERELPGKTWGVNLIHSPAEPDLEQAVADLLVRRGVKLVEASAYLDLTLPLLSYRYAGIRRDGDRIVTPNKVVAKVSRVEVAAKMLSPPSEKWLRELCASGRLTDAQAAMAAVTPVADDLTAEADSGGHTDNRPAISLLPSLIALRDRLAAQFNYARPPRVGAGGGIATPHAAAAMFAAGAAFLVTGSINQSCIESGTCPRVRDMLAAAQQADTAMAPAADMFEMGVKVQVLKRGTLFPMRAGKLYQLYSTYDSIEAIPAAEREMLEKQLFRAPLADIWAQTRTFFQTRDPRQVERADRDAKHRMALVFRWYLGMSSRWANDGVADRQMDYQVWCGPAMGAFNEWVKGTPLEAVSGRQAGLVGMNLLVGAAKLIRVQMLRAQGVAADVATAKVCPLAAAELADRLRPPAHRP